MAIRKLEELVVNRIAAGEIVVTPANALKELVENAVDAGATALEIVAKDGGLKLLQVADNGAGIERADLPLLCERFATSKLAQFSDLEALQTYGFRGEALASISHISRLSVVTKRRGARLGFKAHYLNGALCNDVFRRGGEPQPIAAKDGTQVKVEDLFYNAPQRLRALRPGDEWVRILDVVGRYAVHCCVGITCKKSTEPVPAISVRAGSSLKERIRTVFGSQVAGDLVEFEETSTNFGVLKVRGAISGLNYSNKRHTPMVFFINNRLVACDPLRRTISNVYQRFLPKGLYPFVYLSLDIAPQNVDVNVHPTKLEVRFLYEDEIAEWISGLFHDLLAERDTSRKFQQGYVKRSQDTGLDDTVAKTRQEQRLVRVDASQRTLHSMVETRGTSPVPSPKAEGRTWNNVQLDSVQNLTKQVKEAVHRPLTNVFNNLVYVGLVDAQRRLCCFQYDVKLFVCDYGAVLAQFYYQVALAEFSNYGEYHFEGVALSDILKPLNGEQPPDEIIGKLVPMQDMFLEYFQIDLRDGVLRQLPILLKDVEPALEKLPHFVYRLGALIDYADEETSLKMVMEQIALLYVPAVQDYSEELNSVLENLVFPAVRARFIAPESLVGAVAQIADLPGLYKVFERC